jgi:maleylpyruvate isomerase
MAELLGALQGVRASTADLMAGLDAVAWSDADVAAPTLCTGWTRGHVLTHIARNADGITSTLAGALRGEIVPRYPDGPAGRNADIEAGATRPFAELAADVRDSAARLDRMFVAIAEADGWDLATGDERTARYWPGARWREVEIHRVDLDAGYGADSWPPALVTRTLDEVLDGLDERTDGALRLVITAEGSTTPANGDREWIFGDGEPVEVRGPDWAVLAWLTGRPSAARNALSALPPLAPYR